MPIDTSPRPNTVFTVGHGVHAYPLGAFHGTVLPEEVTRFPDDGRWFHWLATDYPQWLRVNPAENGTITERPVARVYGSDYARTHGYQLAAWIMGAATERLDYPDVTFSAAVDTVPPPGNQPSTSQSIPDRPLD